MGDKFLTEVALKLDVSDKKVLRKASELMKRVSTQKGISCSESCKVVICIELACTFCGTAVSRENAVKYSGCKKSLYMNMLNIISKMLNLDKVYSVKELCLLLGVSEIEAIAVLLLNKYENTQGLGKTELQHPMYPSAAIMAACRLNKIKMNVPKFVELSRLKKAELEELAQTMEKLNEDTKRSVKPKRTSLVSLSENGTRAGLSPSAKKAKKKTEEEFEEEYQEWKRRMLAE